MMPTDRLERQLPELLTELAEPRTPEYLDAMLGLTSRTRQRPAWTLRERWIPMFEIARQPVHAPPIPWRTIGIVVTAVVALVTGVLLVAASQPKVPEPFGLARNGQIAYASDGDILIADPTTHVARGIIGGPDLDSGAVFSLQGTRIAFLRQGPGSQERLMVADADGSNVTQVAGPVVAPTDIAWSPDGSTIAFGISVRGVPAIDLVAADGSGAHVLDVGMPAETPSWRPPDGRMLLFRSEGPSGAGLYLVDPNANVRPLMFTGEGLNNGVLDFVGASWSPDGTRLSFHSQHRLLVGAARPSASRIHIASVSFEGMVADDRMLEFDPNAYCECWAHWSPDGHFILFQHAAGTAMESMVMSADGSTKPVATGLVVPDLQQQRFPDGLPDNPPGFGYEWAPDGSSILAIDYADNSTWVLDPVGGDGTRANLGSDRTPSWQRLAP